ncbi:MAG: nitroreductase family protein [Solobacterium sp.]|nr:nitroreductase family protein [Solobacterium sp.]
MEAFDAIITRRSTRKYSEIMPDRELVEKVITAGRYAPSGHNNQTTHFLVFANKTILSELAEIVKQEFAKMEITEDMYISMKNSVNASKKGAYIFHYNAPVLIVTANQKGYGNAVADSACALENMMITANSLDLGSCWINQLHWLDENPRIREFMYKYGLKEEETITAALVLGYPAEGMPNRIALERKGNPVTWVG